MNTGKLSMKKQKLAAGFIRKLVFSVSIPKELINLISLWIVLLDRWDEINTNNNLKIVDKYNCVERIVGPDYKWYHAFGSDIISYGTVKNGNYI